MTKLWRLAARQALLTSLGIWALMITGVYLRTGTLHPMRITLGFVVIYLFMIVMCRLDLQRQRRMG